MICDPFGLFDCFDKLYYTQEFVECNKKISHVHKIKQIICAHIQIYVAPLGGWKPRAGGPQ